MHALGKVFTTCKEFYQELNSANLSGAIDVIVVRQPDGTLKSSPFHVRFGKLGVLRPGDLQKKVDIEINGDTVPLHMRLDETGSAFFVEHDTPSSPDINKCRVSLAEQSEINDNVSEEGTTPTNSPCSLTFPAVDRDGKERSGLTLLDSETTSKDRKQDRGRVYKSQSAPFRQSSGGGSEGVFSMSEGEEGEGEEEAGPGGPKGEEAGEGHGERRPKRRISRPINKSVAMHNMYHSLPVDCHALSDRESYSRFKSLADSTSTHSDTEFETGIFRSHSASTSQQPRESTTQPAPPDGFLTSMMKLFRGRGQRTAPPGTRGGRDEGEMFLDDLESGFLLPEERSSYLPTRPISVLPENSKGNSVVSSDECDSGVGGDRSPQSRRVLSAPSSPSRDPPEGRGGLLGRSDFAHFEPLMSALRDLQLSLCGPLQDSTDEEHFAKHRLSFEQFSASPDLLLSPSLVVRMGGQFYNWTAAAPMLMSVLVYHRTLPLSTVGRLTEAQGKKPGRGRFSSWLWWGRRVNTSTSDDSTPLASPANETTPTIELATPTIGLATPLGEIFVSSDEGEDTETDREKLPRQPSFKRKRKKSLYPSSEHLERLRLQPGVNEACFSVTTRFQGTSTAECGIFLWDHKDKIVISDIDGTITKSDVAGQILPMLGRDWTQAGVVDLYNGVARNGYKFVYLSARPIGYAGATRGYLRWIRQNDKGLPTGPLLVAPLSLLKAFAKEVIEKKPEEFKIACLREVQLLFPKGHNPFFAGFGNKVTDETSYRAVDIPCTRMYTINPKGELKNSFNRVFKSSYKNLKDYIDHMFPPCELLDEVDGEVRGDEFTAINYWTTPIQPNYLLPEDLV